MRYVLILAFIFLIVPFASAELIFDQPQSVYSMGDTLTTHLSVSAPHATGDFLLVMLDCGDQDLELYRTTLTLAQGDTKKIDLETALTPTIVGTLRGTCDLKASFDGQEATSQSFELSSDVHVEFSLDGSLYNPQDSLMITGSATKANGETVDGYVETTLEPSNLSLKTTVTKGSFSLNFTLPETIPPGTYILKARVYDQTQNKNLNEGVGTREITIRAVLRQVDVSLEQSSVVPGNELTYRFVAYDQAGAPLNKDIEYVIVDPSGTVQEQKLAKTDTPLVFAPSSNAAPGYWRIEARSGEKVGKKLFYIEEYEHVDMNLVNNTLIVHNTGNVVYNRPIEIMIGTYKQIQPITLGVNETKKFKFSAPDATYDVQVSDGNKTLRAQNVPLTGRAIDIGEVGTSPLSYGMLGFIFLVLVSLVFVTNVYIKRRRSGRKLTLGTPLKRARVSAGISEAASTPSGGVREQATIVALRAEGEASTRDALLQTITNRANSAKAHIYQDGTHYLMVFSPTITKQASNEMSAVTSAQHAVRLFEEHNEKMKNKIAYGIGIARGHIIAEGSRPFTFTSIGTLIPNTKKLANTSRDEILLSDEVYKTIMGSVKAERSGDSWRVIDVRDRTQHTGFIDSFLKRQKKL